MDVTNEGWVAGTFGAAGETFGRVDSYGGTRITLGLCILLMVQPAVGSPTGIPSRGQALFSSQCAACHADQKGAPDRQGPNLWGIYGAKPGSQRGFAYSDDFAKAAFIWDEAALDQWLTQPTRLIPDSYMLYQQPDPQIRADIIAYLKTLKSP